MRKVILAGAVLVGLNGWIGPLSVSAESSPLTSQIPSGTADRAALRVVRQQLKGFGTPLKIVARSHVLFSNIGQSILQFKIIDSHGGLHGVALNTELHETDMAKLMAADRAARAARWGALDGPLAQRIDQSPAQAQRVIVWVSERPATRGSRPPPGRERMTGADVDKLYAANDASRIEALTKQTAPLLERIRRIDPDAAAEALSPFIHMTATGENLRSLARDPEVERIYLDLQGYAESGSVANATTGIASLQAQGMLGDGVLIALTEAEGRVEPASLLLGSVVQDVRNVCPTVSDHSTEVASIIIGRQFGLFGPPVGEKGAAPNVTLRVGGSCSTNSSELMDASSRAADWGARAINLSWGLDTQLIPGPVDRFYDDMTINRWRTVVKSAGNRGCLVPGDDTSGPGNGMTTSPGLAFNVITVGGFNDNNTDSWSDDTMYVCSSFANPISTHGDREKPDLAAPAVNLTVTTSGPANLTTVSGTSGAAPMVTSAVALLIQINANLSIWPEINRAILMATATHNIEGIGALSDKDGAGGLSAAEAASLAGDAQRTGGLAYNCDLSTPTVLDLRTLSVGAHTRQRIVLSWDTDPTYQDYATQPSADIDLLVVDSGGHTVASSTRFDNTNEAVDFDTFLGGTFTLRAVKFRCDLPTWLGWAWYTIPLPRRPR